MSSSIKTSLTLVLTHLPLVQHICVSEMSQYWFANGSLIGSPVRQQAVTLPNAGLLSNKLLRAICVHKNAFGIASAKMVAILSRGDELMILSVTITLNIVFWCLLLRIMISITVS